MTFTSVNHDTTIVAVRLHDRQLLIANLHVVESQVEVSATTKQIQVGTNLIVPTLLWLVCDSLVDSIIVGSSVLHIVVTTHSILLMGIQLGLQHIAKHLEVVATSAIAL